MQNWNKREQTKPKMFKNERKPGAQHLWSGQIQWNSIVLKMNIRIVEAELR